MGDPRWTDPDVPELMDFLHIAWGIIANAADWRLDDKQSHEWVKAAERWRDQYHDLLSVSPDRSLNDDEMQAAWHSASPGPCGYGCGLDVEGHFIANAVCPSHGVSPDTPTPGGQT